MFIPQANIGDYLLKQMRNKWKFRRMTAVEKQLIARLPQEAMLLTKEEWQTLYAVLMLRRLFPQAQHGNDEETIIVLKALATFGDKVDLPFRSFWVNMITALWANESGTVLEAVQECLPVLQGRLQSETVGKFLLRPASAEAPPDQLLRPACDSDEADPETLLRASDA